jgi:hypothetical protein
MVIAEDPSRGACSVTTPSRHPDANTGAPDIPDHSDSPSEAVCSGSGLGTLLTCSDNSPLANFDSTAI